MHQLSAYLYSASSVIEMEKQWKKSFACANQIVNGIRQFITSTVVESYATLHTSKILVWLPK